MKMRILIGAAFLLSTAGAGIALAAAGADPLARHFDHQERVERDGGHWQRLAERDHRKDRDEASSRRRHHDDEDDDDDGDGDHRGRATLPQNGPSNPNAPVPDNGLFQGKARPKVEVQ